MGGGGRGLYEWVAVGGGPRGRGGAVRERETRGRLFWSPESEGS
jgi:hypothetical protein